MDQPNRVIGPLVEQYVLSMPQEAFAGQSVLVVIIVGQQTRFGISLHSVAYFGTIPRTRQ